MPCCALGLDCRGRRTRPSGKAFIRMIDDRSLHESLPYWESCQRAGFLLAQCLLFVEAHPDAAGDGRRKSDEPGVGEVVRSTSLAAQWMLQSCSCSRGRAVKHYSLQEIGHGACGVYADHILYFRIVFLERMAFVIHDSTDVSRNHTHAIVRECAIR